MRIVSIEGLVDGTAGDLPDECPVGQYCGKNMCGIYVYHNYEECPTYDAIERAIVSAEHAKRPIRIPYSAKYGDLLETM